MSEDTEGLASGSGEAIRIAVDTGGTFTDLVLIGPDGTWVTHKRLSTPDDPARAVIGGIADVLAKAGLDPHAPRRVVHGSTVATNALLESTGGPAAFVTTAGFEDTLHLARQNRPRLYDLEVRLPPPPLPRDRCLGVAERMAYDGTVLTPLAEADTADLVARVRALGVEAVAVSLLHSYANPEHERRIASALRTALPDVHLTVSHELLPEFREYERGATCIVNALVAPRMTRYLARLSDAIGADALRIMGSAGGTLPAAGAVREPVHTVLSGPAGGVLGALALARAAGVDRIIAFDMGGTSTDVALCDGDLTLTSESRIGDLPLRVPMVDIHTVGAGGGSLAWVDPGGALRVGPRSAGADPGPACYGRQSAPLRPTVTDAHVVLGHLRADQPLGDGLRLDPEAASEAVEGLAGRLGLAVEDAAQGMLEVVEATMSRAIRAISLERGHDPREFTLVPFGGAGGLHACRLAELLDIPRVLVPPHPGLLSAVGMLHAAPLHTFSQAVMARVGGDDAAADLTCIPAVREARAGLIARADEAMEGESIPASRREYRVQVDLRYEGQSYEITVPLDATSVRAFEDQHQHLYGYAAPGRAIEIVAVRLAATTPPTPPTLPIPPPRLAPPPEPVTGETNGVRYLNRDDLREGDTWTSDDPGLSIGEYSATTWMPPGWRLALHRVGHLMLERGPAGGAANGPYSAQPLRRASSE